MIKAYFNFKQIIARNSTSCGVWLTFSDSVCSITSSKGSFGQAKLCVQKRSTNFTAVKKDNT